jgi:type IV pilus assembly protein PilM
MDNPFKTFFAKPDTNVIGIDVGASAIKIVQLAKVKGKAVLKTYGSLALGPYANVTIGQATNLPAERIGEVVKDLMKEANVTTANAGVSIPFRSSLVSLIEVPTLDERSMKEMIPIEARKYIPVPITEVTMDWWIIPHEEEKAFDFAKGIEDTKKNAKTEVLVVSIHNEILNTYQTIVKSAGLTTSFFEIEMFAAIRSLVQAEVNPVMVFDMGAASTKLYIVGIVRQSHIINKGSQDITISISQGLQIPMEKAEKIKRNLGNGSVSDEQVIYEVI